MKIKHLGLYFMFAMCVMAIIFSSCSMQETSQISETQPTTVPTDIVPKKAQMKSICELATLECYYHNVAKYEEKDAEGMWWWTKDKRFWIEYSGIVRLGVDADSLELYVKGENVSIYLPEAKVLDVSIDDESLTEDSFYVDVDSAEIKAADETKAYEEAEANMKEKAQSDKSLLLNAQERAKTLLTNYVKNLGTTLGIDYKIEWSDSPLSAENSTSVDEEETEVVAETDE